MQLNVDALARTAHEAHGRISQLIHETPVLPSRSVGARTGADLWFKAENFQLTGSFKIRGASNKMAMLGQGAEVVTASSGNHGIAASRASVATGVGLTVVLPETVARAKLAKIQATGVSIVLHGEEPGEAERHGRQLAADRGVSYISPYNDPDVMAGQGTIAVELLRQMPQPDAVFVAMGGGGLISGVGAVIKAASPTTRIFGVAAARSDALAASIEAGRIVEVEHQPTLADGVAGGVDEGSLTLPIASRVVDEIVRCDEDQIVEALRAFALEERQLVEGAAALALAGFLKVADTLTGKRVVVLTCGANFDDTRILPLISAT